MYVCEHTCIRNSETTDKRVQSFGLFTPGRPLAHLTASATCHRICNGTNGRLQTILKLNVGDARGNGANASFHDNNRW